MRHDDRSYRSAHAVHVGVVHRARVGTRLEANRHPRERPVERGSRQADAISSTPYATCRYGEAVAAAAPDRCSRACRPAESVPAEAEMRRVHVVLAARVLLDLLRPASPSTHVRE